MSAAPFRRRTLVWIVALSVSSFVLGLVFMILGSDVSPYRSVGADAFSRSAIGHRAFVETLERLGYHVVVSRYDSAGRAAWEALLVVAEPRLHVLDAATRSELGRTIRDHKGPVLVVLPKWAGQSDPEQPRWVGSVQLLDERQVDDVIRTLGIDGHVRRLHEGPSDSAWRAAREIAVEPSLGTPQLIRSDELHPVVWHADGLVVGRTETTSGAPLVVIADPDLLSNHGLRRGRNAVLVVRVIESLIARDERIVVDEVFHGHETEPSLWRELFEFPLAIATMHGLVVLLLVVWMATRRFGAPAALPPEIEAGKAFLIENTAELLRYGGHAGYALNRFFLDAIAEVSRKLQAPSRLRGPALREWLDDQAAQRGVESRAAELGGEVSGLVESRDRGHERRVLALADRIHRWRKEMVDGPRSRSIH